MAARECGVTFVLSGRLFVIIGKRVFVTIRADTAIYPVFCLF